MASWELAKKATRKRERNEREWKRNFVKVHYRWVFSFFTVFAWNVYHFAMQPPVIVVVSLSKRMNMIFPTIYLYANSGTIRLGGEKQKRKSWKIKRQKNVGWKWLRIFTMRSELFGKFSLLITTFSHLYYHFSRSSWRFNDLQWNSDFGGYITSAKISLLKISTKNKLEMFIRNPKIGKDFKIEHILIPKFRNNFSDKIVIGRDLPLFDIIHSSLNIPSLVCRILFVRAILHTIKIEITIMAFTTIFVVQHFAVFTFQFNESSSYTISKLSLHLI